MKVCLDPGHGGKDRGNRGPTGYVEADGTLDIALRVRSILKKKGIDPIMTRDKDITVSLAGEL
jgi:N-acetylmuramoyl-L-alanine amidase